MGEAAPDPDDIVRSIQKAVRDHTGAAAQSDDLTLVCFGRAASGDGAEPSEAS